MRLMMPLNHGRTRGICASYLPQPWENQGYMRLMVPLNHGRTGVYAPHGPSQPWEEQGYMRLMVPLHHGGWYTQGCTGGVHTVVYPGVYRWCTYGGIPRVVCIQGGMMGVLYLIPGRHAGCTIPPYYAQGIPGWVYTSPTMPPRVYHGVHPSDLAYPS